MNDNLKNNSFSTIAGMGVGYVSYKYLPGYIQRPYGRWFLTECHDISEVEHNKYYSATQKALESSGLKEKEVELINIDKNNFEGVTKDTLKKIDKTTVKLVNDIYNKILDKLKIPKASRTEIKLSPQKTIPKWKYILFGKEDSKQKFKSTLKVIAKGDNAGYNPILKNIYVNKDKMGFSTAHEAGHAFNANSTKLLKTLALGRHITVSFVPALLVTALIKKRKPEYADEPNDIKRKKNFLKDNIGVLTFGCMLPTVAEEGLASINGAKLVKKYLTPQEMRKLNITYAKAWSTYLLGATLMGVFAQFAVKVKDKLVQPEYKSA